MSQGKKVSFSELVTENWGFNQLLKTEEFNVHAVWLYITQYYEELLPLNYAGDLAQAA